MNTYIAYVEDDAEDIEIFEDLFCSRSGTPVQYFSDGTKLMQHLQGTQDLPCLILLDMANPVQSGKETVQSLQQDKRLQKIPLILFSSLVKSIQLSEFAHADINLLEKPGTIDEWEQACFVITETCKRGAVQSVA